MFFHSAFFFHSFFLPLFFFFIHTLFLTHLYPIENSCKPIKYSLQTVGTRTISTGGSTRVVQLKPPPPQVQSRVTAATPTIPSPVPSILTSQVCIVYSLELCSCICVNIQIHLCFFCGFCPDKPIVHWKYHKLEVSVIHL